MKFIKKLPNSSFVWKFIPLLLSVSLLIIGYVFSHRIEFGFCQRILSSGAGGLFCGDSFPYYENLGEALSLLGFYSGLSFMVLLFLPIHAIQLWTVCQLLWIIGWVMHTSGDVGSNDAVLVLGFGFFILTSVLSVAYGCYLRHKDKKKIWTVIVPLVLFLSLLTFIFIGLMSFSFPMMG